MALPSGVPRHGTDPGWSVPPPRTPSSAQDTLLDLFGDVVGSQPPRREGEPVSGARDRQAVALAPEPPASQPTTYRPGIGLSSSPIARQ